MTRKYFGVLLTTIGILLLGIAIVGHFTTIGDYQNEQARDWETFNPDLAADLRSWSSLSAEAEHRIANSRGGGMRP